MRDPEQEGRAKEPLTSEPRVSSLECESTAWELPRAEGVARGAGAGASRRGPERLSHFLSRFQAPQAGVRAGGVEGDGLAP